MNWFWGTVNEESSPKASLNWYSSVVDRAELRVSVVDMARTRSITSSIFLLKEVDES